MKLVLAACMALALSWAPAHARVVHRHKHAHYRFEATAFSRRGITAVGTRPHWGTAAADPRILPLGTRIRVSGAGPYSGEYTVMDVGGKVVGAHIDLYIPNPVAARRFGKRLVTVRVIRWGCRRRG